MEQALVSIVIPVYNSAKYLDQCVTSIVNQSYRNLEIILVDDGSSDCSPQMCDTWAEKDSRIRVIHKENAGAGYARNTGIENASGGYICFFDSDDYVDPCAVEKAYDLVQKESAEIVIFGSTSVDQNGNVIACHIPTAEKLCYRDEEVQLVFLPDLIDGKHNKSAARNLCLSFWACLFSMDLIRRSDWRIVSEREYLSEDSYSLIKLYNQVRCVAILPEALYFYRETQGSLSNFYRADAHERTKKFYQQCLELAEERQYLPEVHNRIAGLFLTQEIGVMKKIISADLPRNERVRQIAGIVCDETVQAALSKINWRYSSRARNVLIWTMRRKMSRVVYLLVSLQLAKAR